MKTLIIALGFLFAFSLNACAQEKVPVKVKSTFNQKYPNAKEVGWNMEKENEWEAEFEMNEKEMSATFDQTGQWLETETKIKEHDFPVPVKETLKTQFKGYNVERAEYLESPKYTGYEINLEGKKGDVEVLIGENGKVMKQKTDKIMEKGEKSETEEKGDEDND